MNLRGSSRGYTILETIIVVSVAGGLFIIAALALNGRQQRMQFRTSANDLVSKVQDMVNDVNTGYFPETLSSTTLNCAEGNTASSQGTNQSCIFVGKLVLVDIDNEQLLIYTLAGNRLNTGTNIEVQDFVEAEPQSVSIDNYEIKYSEDITQIGSEICTSGNVLQGFVVGTTFASTTADVLNPGTINSDVIPICGSTPISVDSNGDISGIDWTTIEDNRSKELFICLGNNDEIGASIVINTRNQKGSSEINYNDTVRCPS